MEDARPILCFATQGAAHFDGDRVRELLAPLEPDAYPFDHERKIRSATGLLRAIRRRRPKLVVMEGTGIAGGIAGMLADALLGTPFIVSSGDAIGPYLKLRSRFAGPVGALYERALCRRCAGYVGWTPYLAGRALTYGAPRAMTAPGWTSGTSGDGVSEAVRDAVRAQLGVSADTLLVGLVGSLNWRARVGYTYGAELVLALRGATRGDIAACIVGGGSGYERLKQLAGDELGRRVFLPGPVERGQVPGYLAAFDVASLPQSVDGVGSFRYSIKLAEYLEAGVPVITGQTPLAYDLDEGWLWRLPGDAPWSPTYVTALSELLEGLTRPKLETRRDAARRWRASVFDKHAQQIRMREFVSDVLAARA